MLNGSNGMKRVVSSLFLLLLLSACRTSEATPSSSPTPVPSSVPTPVAATTQPPSLEDAEPWWTGVDLELLPTEENPVYQVNGVTWRITCEEPKLGVTLYDVEKEGVGCQFVLRKGEILDEVFRAPGVGSDCFYSLYGGDFDTDGQEEYAISLYREFYICKQNEQGGWDSLFYGSEDYSALLSDILDVRTDQRSVTVYCAGTSASYRLGEGIEGEVIFNDAYPESPLWFEFSNDTILAVIPMMVSVKDTSVADILGALRYTLAYDGETFTPQNFHLESAMGV